MSAHLFRLFYFVAWIVFATVFLAGALFTKPAARMESWRGRLIQLAWSAAAILLLAWPRMRWGLLGARVLPRSPAWVYLGLVMTIGGIGFALWARFFLGRNWSGRVTIKKGHELIRLGPYAIVRHPIYTGMIAALMGTAIGVGQIRGILAVAIVAAGLWFKSRTEERFLREEFGEEYARYRQEVKALVPFVW